MAAIKRKFFFEMKDGSKLPVNKSIEHVSSLVQEIVKNAGDSDTILIPATDKNLNEPEVAMINSFLSYCDEHLPERLVIEKTNKDFWMEHIPTLREQLRPLIQEASKDLVITSANSGDYLQCPAFITFATYFLCERAQTMKLSELRTLLDEDEEFDREQAKIIEECPEFADL